MERRARTVDDAALWGAGWAAASLLIYAFGTTLDLWRPGITCLATVPVGAAMFGVPIYRSARSAGGRFPKAEALVWVAALVVLTVAFAAANRPSVAAVNAVTTEEMRSRSDYYRTWHYPRELVWGFWSVVMYSVLCAGVTLLLEWRGRIALGISRAMVFATCIATSLFVGLAIFAIFGPLLWSGLPTMPTALAEGLGVISSAFVAGYLIGCGIGYGRRLMTA